jgi:hypothetical protein
LGAISGVAPAGDALGGDGDEVGTVRGGGDAAGRSSAAGAAGTVSGPDASGGEAGTARAGARMGKAVRRGVATRSK